MSVLELTLNPTIEAEDDDDEVSHAGRYVSEADYWAHYYHNDGEICYEWNNGILEEKPVSDFAGSLMYLWFVGLLRQYLETRPIANVTALDLGFKLKLGHQETIRRPDLGVIRHDNPIQMAADDCTYKGLFDMCIEAISDSKRSEIERDIVTKKAEYARGGVQEYYILDPKNRHMTFFQRGARGVYLPIQPINGVIHSNVLPGFRFRLTDLHRRPSLMEMAEDELYQDFILPEYQAEKRRADLEQARADMEQAKAERLAAKLRELGFSPDEI